MAPFVDARAEVRIVNAIQNLGDFTPILCSAWRPARIGQAFTITDLVIPIPHNATVMETKNDIIKGHRTFSDGCSTISLELFKTVWTALASQRRHERPTVLQTRFRGSKGMISLDTMLNGRQLHFHESMNKFNANIGERKLEICGAGYRLC